MPKSLSNLGLPLNYQLYRPSQKTQSPILKTIILMHGRGDQKESYEILAKEINLCSVQYILLDAPHKSWPGFSWYHYPYGVNSPDLGDSQSLINKSLNIIESHGIKTEDIILGGFSQGASMALNTLFTNRKAKKMAGFIALSPRCFWGDIQNLSPLKSPFIFLSHGQQDDILPYIETESLAHKLQKQNLNLTWAPFKGAHEIDIEQIQSLRDWLGKII